MFNRLFKYLFRRKYFLPVAQDDIKDDPSLQPSLFQYFVLICLVGVGLLLGSIASSANL